ncbi:hypothetical protein PPACK8108_LOCUS19285 [Phakopsora pachyrhizi]|uniref:Uncharacterized protein n=1 Tax=Phakopsora pachyrhizi TaxID=170000 RepID=A0AAV0BC20_PHAPC|nr:hypothetical protein PPACK8108_LOCUS19285 [Phakopsora pachyrhizi]
MALADNVHLRDSAAGQYYCGQPSYVGGEKGEESKKIGDLDWEETILRSSRNSKLNKKCFGQGGSSGPEKNLDTSPEDVEKSDEEQPGLVNFVQKRKYL